MSKTIQLNANELKHLYNSFENNFNLTYKEQTLLIDLLAIEFSNIEKDEVLKNSKYSFFISKLLSKFENEQREIIFEALFENRR
jgi:hypothetical protein